MKPDQPKTETPAPVSSTPLVRQDIFGWFDSPDQTTPAHDPGLKTICPVCANELSRPMKTISMMTVDTGSDRSYFFRVHKHCWEGITERERDAIEGSLVDAITTPIAPAWDMNAPRRIRCGSMGGINCVFELGHGGPCRTKYDMPNDQAEPRPGVDTFDQKA